MAGISLSDAIRLGSLTIDNPAAGDIDRCAITMALVANGQVPQEVDPTVFGQDDPREPDHREDYIDGPQTKIPLRTTEMQWWNIHSALRSHEELLSVYPWLEETFADCLWCGTRVRSTELLHHAFDEHVMTGAATIDALASWIAQFEPEPFAPPRPRPCLDLGLGIRFSDEAEKKAIIEAASAVGMRPDEYIATAVRLVTEQQIPLDLFRRPVPQIAAGHDVRYAPYMHDEQVFDQLRPSDLLPV